MFFFIVLQSQILSLRIVLRKSFNSKFEIQIGIIRAKIGIYKESQSLDHKLFILKFKVKKKVKFLQFYTRSREQLKFKLFRQQRGAYRWLEVDYRSMIHCLTHKLDNAIW